MLLRFSMIITFCMFSSVKASKPKLRRHLNNNEIEGTPVLRLSEPGEGTWLLESFEEDEASGTPLVYEIDGLRQSYFKSSGIVSGKDSITLSAATKSRGKGNMPDKITITPGTAVTITRGGSDARRRRLAPKTGTLSVLVVRVSTTSAAENPQRSAVQLASDCFGIGAPDTVQMVSRFAACSGGQLNLIPAANTTAVSSWSTPAIINGVTNVKINFSATGVSSSTIENAARSAAVAKVGSLSKWNLVMFTWTQNANWGGAAAYAYLNSQVSCYMDVHIWKMGIQVHEIGHNLGLGHSGEKVEYDDHTCFMGNPSWEDDRHAMCFNGAKSWELDWYAARNGYKTVIPSTDGNTVDAKMAALDDYLMKKTQAEHSVVLKIVDNSQADDYYVMYNRKKGVNGEVVEYPDEVTIIKGRAGGQSYLVGHLSLSQTLVLPNFDGTSISLVVKLCEFINSPAPVEYARVNVYWQNGINEPVC